MRRAIAGFAFALASASAGAQLAVPEAGGRLVAKHNCRACHSIGGEGGAVGPDLNQVTLRRDTAWLMRWLENPSVLKPGTLMPAFAWELGERDAVIAYLRTFATPVDKTKLLARRGAKAGRALIEAYQCFACHKVAEHPGRAIYPDLTNVGQRRDRAWERRWLAAPEAVIPGTFMPNFGLSSEEIEAIVSYLYP
ncbi:MAG: c-type cytochrome [Burkholderiales bacterium]